MTAPRPASRARGRRLVLATIVTLAATVWAAMQDDDSPASAPPPRASNRVPQGVAESGPVAPWPELPHADARPAWREALPQGLAAWGPPPPPPPPPAAATAPEVPAIAQPPEFPYTLIGRLDDGQPRALLTNRTRSFGAKAADVIDGTWRVDAVQPDGVTLTWLPGGISRTLAFPSS